MQSIAQIRCNALIKGHGGELMLEGVCHDARGGLRMRHLACLDPEIVGVVPTERKCDQPHYPTPLVQLSMQPTYGVALEIPQCAAHL